MIAAARAARAEARATATAAAAREADDDALLARPCPHFGADEGDDSGLLCLELGRWLEAEAERITGSADEGGRFLTKLADGADATAEWPINGEAHLSATQLRFRLIANVGARHANALLRAITRHGRLLPGFAPKVEGPTVSAMDRQQTPLPELRRIMASDGAPEGGSPFL